MVSSFAPWFGQTVTLRLITGESREPLRGIIVAESGGAIRFRIGAGWDIDIYKTLILTVEQDKGPAT